MPTDLLSADTKLTTSGARSERFLYAALSPLRISYLRAIPYFILIMYLARQMLNHPHFRNQISVEYIQAARSH